MKIINVRIKEDQIEYSVSYRRPVSLPHTHWSFRVKGLIVHSSRRLSFKDVKISRILNDIELSVIYHFFHFKSTDNKKEEK